MKKKNDALGWLVYLLMLAIALIVGLVLIRPVFTSENNYQQYLPTGFSGILFVVVAIVAGILFNAVLLEVGHLIGAKIGKFKVWSFCIFALGFREDPQTGKKKFKISDFDGLTGETKVVPLDQEKSDARHIIYAPLVGFFVEVVAMVALIVWATAMKSNPGLIWVRLLALIVLAIGGMIFLYDIFPARLDAKNDGYLMLVLGKKINRQAYNAILLGAYKMYKGEALDDMPIYDEVTNFTNEVNRVSLYAALNNKDYEKALGINDLTILCKDNVSDAAYNEAIAQKASLYYLSKDKEVAKEFFVSLPLEQKKSIAALRTPSSVRAYILISALTEESETETEAAVAKIKPILKRAESSEKAVEEELFKKTMEKVFEEKPEWDFAHLGFENPSLPKEEANEEEPKTEEITDDNPPEQ